MSKQLTIAFAGTPEFAIPSLRALIEDEGIDVVKVFTQPDKPVGRGGKITPPPVKVFAQEQGIEVLQPEKLEKTDLEEPVPAKAGMDFLVVVAYGMILPTELLDMPKYGCVNLHASLLPKFRGASPIQSSILAGEEKTGVTFMQISEELDSGAVFAQDELEIGEKNAAELGVELAELGTRFPDVLRKIASGELQSVAQDDAQATFCEKIRKEDGKVDWEKDSADVLARKLRAFFSWPGVWTLLRQGYEGQGDTEGKVLKLLEFEVATIQVDSITPEPAVGGVFETSGNIFVRTVDGVIELRRVQLEGKKAMGIEDFVRGNLEFVDARLG